jgi:hypothetical protein
MEPSLSTPPSLSSSPSKDSIDFALPEQVGAFWAEAAYLNEQEDAGLVNADWHARCDALKANPLWSVRAGSQATLPYRQAADLCEVLSQEAWQAAAKQVVAVAVPYVMSTCPFLFPVCQAYTHVDAVRAAKLRMLDDSHVVLVVVSQGDKEEEASRWNDKLPSELARLLPVCVSEKRDRVHCLQARAVPTELLPNQHPLGHAMWFGELQDLAKRAS